MTGYHREPRGARAHPRSAASNRWIGFLGALAAVLLSAGCGRPPLAPDGGSAIPEPRPVSTAPYQVGAYYFPGWRTLEKWKVLDAFPERTPLLGYYREGDPTVMDWQIKWAVEHGISFFAFDWYWDRGRRSLEHALRDGYFRARFRPYMKFCLLWANHNPRGSSSEADLLAMTDYWVANYLRQPDYLTIDGRPVVIVFTPRGLRKDMGTDAVRAAFALMRERVRAAGLPGLFIMGAAHEETSDLEALVHEGYDAGTGYNYPRAGMPDESALSAPYAWMVDGYEQIWYSIATQRLIDYAPVTEPGWDSRPWQGDKALVRTERDPEKFEDMLRRARVFTDRYPLSGGRKLVLIEAWNEAGEGAMIEPHRQWGFAHLDAVRRVFARDGAQHRDLTPADLGLTAPQAPSVPRPAGPGPRAPGPRRPRSGPAPWTPRRAGRRARSPRPLAPGRGAAGAAARAAGWCRGPAIREWPIRSPACATSASRGGNAGWNVSPPAGVQRNTPSKTSVWTCTFRLSRCRNAG
jgi:hypothetical protein